jgi:hypothetical protein
MAREGRHDISKREFSLAQLELGRIWERFGHKSENPLKAKKLVLLFKGKQCLQDFLFHFLLKLQASTPPSFTTATLPAISQE